MKEFKTEIENVFKPYRLAKKVELDTGHKAFTEVYNEEIIQALIQLFNKHIEDKGDDIVKQFRTEVFFGLISSSPNKLAQDIINILKIKE